MDKKQQFQQDMKNELDRQTLDADTRRALQAARISALDNETQRSTRRWIPATALSSLALVILGTFIYRGINDIELPQISADDLAVITSEDELELFEDLEFYVWFDQDKNV